MYRIENYSNLPEVELFRFFCAVSAKKKWQMKFRIINFIKIKSRKTKKQQPAVANISMFGWLHIFTIFVIIIKGELNKGELL